MTDERRRDRMRSFTHDFPPDKIWGTNTAIKGEMTMSERLTISKFQQICTGVHLWKGTGLEAIMNELWAAIESDREAIRAEMIKCRYEIGERLQYKWLGKEGIEYRDAQVQLVTRDGGHLQNVKEYSVRRPPKTNPMTTEQKINAIKSYLQTPTMTIWDKINETTLDALMKAANLPTEVEE